MSNWILDETFHPQRITKPASATLLRHALSCWTKCPPLLAPPHLIAISWSLINGCDMAVGGDSPFITVSRLVFDSEGLNDMTDSSFVRIFVHLWN